jgi:tetratricopeptide (TPR) repeat protein
MQFRRYVIDPVHRTVTSPAGRAVRLEPKTCDLLLYFIEHPNEILSRERLIADVWHGKFVTDDAVMVAVYALRQAFDDDSRSPLFIETIRGRGYRWIALPDEKAGRRPALHGFVWMLLIAIGTAAFVWAVVWPQPMPSMERTNALVRAHARGLFFSERRTRPDLELAMGEFRKAILVDERFAEPHAARAEESFRRAIALDPSLPGIRRRYSYLLGATGRFDEATSQARMAADVEPTSTVARIDLAWTHMLAGRFAEAEELYREALRLESANVEALFSLGYCLDLRGAPAEAMKSYRRALQVLGASDAVLAQFDRAFANDGLPGVYETWRASFEPSDAPRFIVAFYAARAGRTADALALLRESIDRREAGTIWLPVHPAFKPLRGQREFEALVASSFQTR